MKEMLKKRGKLILIAAFAALLVVGSIAGVALAQTGTGTNPGKTLLARVATIVGVDQQKLQDAFNTAKREMRDEALSKRLQDLVSQGKMTQQQADQYKSWVQSRPELPSGVGPHFGRGFGHGFKGMPPVPPPPK